MNYFSFLYFGPCSFEVLVSNTSIFIKSLPWYHKNHESETAYYTLTLLTRVNFCLQVHRFCSNFQCFYLFIYLIMYERIKISSWYYLINSKIESQLRSKYIYKLPMLSGFAWEIGRKTWRKENKLLIWTEIFSETSTWSWLWKGDVKNHWLKFFGGDRSPVHCCLEGDRGSWCFSNQIWRCYSDSGTRVW